MERIKVFFSYIIAIIFTIALSYVVLNSYIYSSISYKNINKSLTKNRINYLSVGKATVDDDIYPFLDLDDVVNDFAANKILYEFGMTDIDPKIDRNLVNKKVKNGLDEYIDYRISEAEGGLSIILDEVGFNKEIKDAVIEELSKKYNIDYKNSEIVKEEDLNKVYDDINENVNKYKNYLSIVKVLTNKDYKRIAIIVLIAAVLLLAIVNFNIIAAFAYTIVPLIISLILMIIISLVTSNINFSGTDYAKILNDIMHSMFSTSIEYLVLLAIVLFVDVLIYFIIKNINIEKSHKKGKATLDTLFDDYDKDKQDETSEQ